MTPPNTATTNYRRDTDMPRGIPKGRETLSARLAYHSMPVPECGCHIWTGRVEGRGYGRLGGTGWKIRAHRAAWEVANGRAVPPGMFVLHKCDTPSCINPDHLFIGDHQDNMNDKKAKGRVPSGEAHGMAKLTNADVAAILAASAQGVSAQDLAMEFSVCVSTVQNIKSGRNWKELQRATTLNGDN